MALNLSEKGFIVPKTVSDCKSEKYEPFNLCLQVSNLAPKMGQMGPAWQLARSSLSIVT